MKAHVEDVERRLAEFERRQSFGGRLENYALSRVNHLLFRQIFSIAFVATLVFAGHFSAAFGALGLLMFGELVDCGFLTFVPRRIARGDDLGRLYTQSALSAALQGLSLASAALIPALVSDAPSATILSMSFLSCLAINAGLLIHHHRLATQARLAALMCSAAIIVFLQAGRGGFADENMLFNTAGILLMLSLVYSFVNFAMRGYLSQVRRSRDLLQRSTALASANAELEEKRSEVERLALIAQNASDSIFITDSSAKILWANEAFSSLTGYELSEAVGVTPSQLLNGPKTNPKTAADIRSAIKQGKPLRTEIRNRCKDGSDIWVETNQVPVTNEGGEVEFVIAIERDVTKARQHAHELANAKRAAEKGEKAMSQFLATMSHEIRTPMNGIIGMADLLEAEGLNTDQAKYVSTIRYSAEALMRIINDILDFSKLDAGKIVICPVDFDLLACTEAALSILRPKALEKGIYLDLECVPPLTETVHGDDGRVRQILLNIVGNAIKFTQSGGVSIKLRTEPQGRRLRLTYEICDTGIGIPATQLHTIFDEFNQASGDTTREFGGTGLGLTISRFLAREMEGDITIRSQEGEGSTFTVSLLLAPAAGQPPSAKAKALAPPINLDGTTALIADDNKTNQLVIRKFLRNTGLNLCFAQNGREALDLTRDHAPRIVFMDMSMPEMDGLEATRAIRADESLTQPTIVALTANVYASDKAACLAAGMDGFLAKPLKRAELMQWLADL